MPKVLSRTEHSIVVEDDGGFVTVIHEPMSVTLQKSFENKTPEEIEALNKKLDDLGIMWF